MPSLGKHTVDIIITTDAPGCNAGLTFLFFMLNSVPYAIYMTQTRWACQKLNRYYYNQVGICAKC